MFVASDFDSDGVSMALIDEFSIVNSSLFIYKPIIYTFLYPPRIMLAQYYNVWISMLPIHWEQGVWASIKSIRSQGWQVLWKHRKQEGKIFSLEFNVNWMEVSVLKVLVLGWNFAIVGDMMLSFMQLIKQQWLWVQRRGEY